MGAPWGGEREEGSSAEREVRGGGEVRGERRRTGAEG